MIYIRKEGLSEELNQKIIEIRKSDAWKSIEKDDTESIRQIFDNEFPKNDIKTILIHEQKGLCAYCMRRIRMDSHSRIEHFMPLSAAKEGAIDYNNLLGVCDGGEKSVEQQGHILCCDAHKKDIVIHTSPLNKAQMDKIAYKPDGTIYTEPKDAVMEKDINETLLLNGVRKEDGSVRDTSTELLKGRKDAYERAKLMMYKLNKDEKCTSASVKKIIDKLQEEEVQEEYVGVKLYYLKKRYNAMVRRGK
ncbi:MAG: TIGR02646 family protein [Clostridium sp.]|nr:TIGR02646 family protein [Clostridium sp.]